MNHRSGGFTLVLSGLTLLASLGIAGAAYTESWDDGAGSWRYWAGTLNEPEVSTVATGGQSGGYATVDLDQVLDWGPVPAPVHYVYWPLYLYPGDLQAGTTCDFTGASAQIFVNGNGVDLRSGELYFYVSRYDPETDDYRLMRTNSPLTVGDGTWAENSFSISGNEADWTLIQEDGPDPFTVGETLVGATEFGFVITGVLESEENPTGILNFDEFSTTAAVIPEPLASWLLLLAFGWLRWRTR